MDKKPKILVIHGPNLNMLGRREPTWYGSATLEEIDAEIKETAQEVDTIAETFQSNYEGAIIEKIHQAMETCDGVIINPAAYTHTSVAIRDALLMLDIPIVEVHLSNIYQRETFRHRSFVSDVATARVAGFGKEGYMMAVRALSHMVARKTNAER
ncbi:MAG: type II 3-dehydroquinate dehydratase [Thermodesulfobacteriota bacterium]|nr:type II 3-dehydroquinate dehydratase [Thermodesulfobacteriota bacterium]